MPINPADYKTPGQLIQALLDERGWAQRILATVLDIQPTTLGRMIKGEKPVDVMTALSLSEVFPDIGPEVFLQLQQEYDLAKARIAMRPDPARAHRAQLFGDLPIAEMITRGWLDATDVRDVPRVERALATFFGEDSASDIEILPHAAKRTNVTGDVTPAQLAWLYRVRQLAQNVVVQPYSTKALQEAIKKLRLLLASPEEARRAPRILAEAGVRLVVVAPLTRAKIDGVCFWLNERTPVIGLSMRFDRLDNFWFVLRHECEHVLRGDGRTAVALDAELERERAGTGPDVAEQERLANEAAADFCVPQKLLGQFVARKAPIFIDRDVIAFASMVKVHPGILAGQLQHATARYERFHDYLTKVRDIVLPNVLHDGWGDVAPVGHLA
ncbi:MAG TPA: ImmA/IrrE family metallo-endopeptidase [Pirellulales bacterium]|jgi:HTH-type transcriptional regulator/antitoxin HigA|nr:ImmA/IrrE family metallo-endopeptidase [Pirellulales bacterium]